MKKSISTHLESFRSSSLHHSKFPSSSKFRSPDFVSPNKKIPDPLAKSNYYKPSFFNFTTFHEKGSKSLRDQTTLIHDKKQRSYASNYEKKKTNNEKKQKDLSLERNLDLDLDMIFHQSPSNIVKNTKNSKAYSDAMKALQDKVKRLEMENRELEKKFKEFQGNIQEVIEKKIADKTNFFVVLEKNLKEKINILEDEKKELEKFCMTLKNELQILQDKMKFFEDKSNLDYKEFLQEKTDLRKIIMDSREKIRFLEEENKNLMKCKNDILKENKCISNSINNYENTFQLLQKQNEILKSEAQKKNFISKKALEIEKKEENITNNQEMRLKLEEREKEIDFLKEKFHAFLMKNDLKIMQKDSKTDSIHAKPKDIKTPGSFKKQKPKKKIEYENKTLENMISNIISVNSFSQQLDKEAKENNIAENSRNLHENAFFSNSIESAKKIVETQEKAKDDKSIKFTGFSPGKYSKKTAMEIEMLEKELSGLIDKYKNLSEQVSVNFDILM